MLLLLVVGKGSGKFGRDNRKLFGSNKVAFLRMLASIFIDLGWFSKFG